MSYMSRQAEYDDGYEDGYKEGVMDAHQRVTYAMLEFERALPESQQSAINILVDLRKYINKVLNRLTP